MDKVRPAPPQKPIDHKGALVFGVGLGGQAVLRLMGIMPSTGLSSEEGGPDGVH